jgi:hypothetical protein
MEDLLADEQLISLLLLPTGSALTVPVFVRTWLLACLLFLHACRMHVCMEDLLADEQLISLLLLPTGSALL